MILSVGKRIINHHPVITILQVVYKPFPVMGGLWHCFFPHSIYRFVSPLPSVTVSRYAAVVPIVALQLATADAQGPATWGINDLLMVDNGFNMV